MNRYATVTPEARELIAELEFVWDQVKDVRVDSHSDHSAGSSHSDHQLEGSHLHETRQSIMSAATRSQLGLLPRDTTRGGIHSLLTAPPHPRSYESRLSSSRVLGVDTELGEDDLVYAFAENITNSRAPGWIEMNGGEK
jgi:hypothetical protein